MKRLLISILLMFPGLLIAQKYSEVVDVPGKNSDQLYSSAREWFADSFNSANDVLQMDDPVAGKLIGKGTFELTIGYIIWRPNFTIKIFVKDGKYKYEISDIKIDRSVKESSFNVTEDFQKYIDQKEYFKNGSNPEWLKENNEAARKLSNNLLKKTAAVNSEYYKLIVDTENRFKNLISDLHKGMIKSEDDW